MPEIVTPPQQAPLRDVFQLMGAVLFVIVMLGVGWHAAHYSGVWPA
ncbi:hypothetical protein [Gluconacetobacter tumulisoli]|uniref:Uncharacterized protein n=1 Tax=Gluconacetobacter tumulisoli TaxID=1286189 RepID=A0A7W4PKC6_9PROT|nr:hypothetical protein [Gluconacetobacter tumulisoli]MBB2201262.1 hypothetical protein [Gluconacetobacter tumulisoli]